MLIALYMTRSLLTGHPGERPRLCTSVVARCVDDCLPRDVELPNVAARARIVAPFFCAIRVGVDRSAAAPLGLCRISREAPRPAVLIIAHPDTPQARDPLACPGCGNCTPHDTTAGAAGDTHAPSVRDSALVHQTRTRRDRRPPRVGNRVGRLPGSRCLR